MTPTPTRETPAGRAHNDLRNLARKHHRDVAEYLTIYALEGLLARLAVSTQTDDFVLKGGVLMAAFAARRPTRDIDLRACSRRGEAGECLDRHPRRPQLRGSRAVGRGRRTPVASRGCSLVAAAQRPSHIRARLKHPFLVGVSAPRNSLPACVTLTPESSQSR